MILDGELSETVLVYLTAVVLDIEAHYRTVMGLIDIDFLSWCEDNALIEFGEIILITVFAQHVEQHLACLRTVKAVRIVDLYLTVKVVAVIKTCDIDRQRVIADTVFCLDIQSGILDVLRIKSDNIAALCALDVDDPVVLVHLFLIGESDLSHIGSILLCPVLLIIVKGCQRFYKVDIVSYLTYMVDLLCEILLAVENTAPIAVLVFKLYALTVIGRPVDGDSIGQYHIPEHIIVDAVCLVYLLDNIEFSVIAADVLTDVDMVLFGVNIVHNVVCSTESITIWVVVIAREDTFHMICLSVGISERCVLVGTAHFLRCSVFERAEIDTGISRRDRSRRERTDDSACRQQTSSQPGDEPFPAADLPALLKRVSYHTFFHSLSYYFLFRTLAVTAKIVQAHLPLLENYFWRTYKALRRRTPNRPHSYPNNSIHQVTYITCTIII